MFWGLIMEPQRRYTQKVKKAFHISMAAMDISTSTDEPAQVMCGFEGRNYLLCTLQKPELMQVPLDLNFNVGDELSFAANGKCHIHLTGYLIEEFPELSGLDELEEMEEEEEEVEQKEKVKKKKRNSKENIENGPPLKKNKAVSSTKEDDEEEDSDDSDVDVKALLGKSLDEEDDGSYVEEEEDDEDEDEEDDDDDEDGGEEEEDAEDEEVSSMSEPESEDETPKKKEAVAKINGVPSKKQQPGTPVPNKQNKEVKTPKGVKENQSPKEVKKEKKTPEKTSQTPSKKKVLQGGVIVEDLKEGQGPNAKNGKFVTVYYEGRLKQNNKLFDSTNKGNGFSFRLGGGEVIKGWDVGVAGMKVGGKRRITCPPEMGYGAKGSPPAIPANSTLVFEVEMRKIR